jgi:hypothetical protein
MDPEGIQLCELVKAYDVRWDTAPEQSVIDGELRSIGLRLELTALHARPPREPTAGCLECKPVVDALERIIHAVLPKDHRRSHYEVHVPPDQLQYTASGRPEITATITILHNDGINEPVDACEKRCLAEMCARLAELGAKRGRR